MREEIIKILKRIRVTQGCEVLDYREEADKIISLINSKKEVNDVPSNRNV